MSVRDEKARREGKGAWSLDGKMVDVPVVRRTTALLDKMVACGIDMEGYRHMWK